MENYIILAGLLAGLGAAENAATSSPDTPGAIAGEYCARAETIDADEIPASVTAILEDKGGLYTGEEIAEAIYVSTAIKIASASESADICNDAILQGTALFQAVLEQQTKSFRRRGGYRASRDENIRAVQNEITRLWREDQAGRGAYIRLQTEDREGAAYWARQLSAAHLKKVDHEATLYIEGLLDDYDWIDIERFGRSVSAHAWILIQHADHRPDLQEKVLKRMEPYLATGGVKKQNYAYLWDRVAVNTGRKQRYGTQPTWECDESRRLTLQPLEDPENVNARRAEMNLNTVEEGLEEMARGVCGFEG
ncbi:MAG: DUF6624 domain-containing protein [Pseudomonadota bacterium]